VTAQRAGNAWWPVSVWEFDEVQRKLREIAALPYGYRKRARRNLADSIGLSERTLLRWQTYNVEAVSCGKYEALFVIGKKRPSQVTPWEKAA
jgi:hypothetical protein